MRVVVAEDLALLRDGLVRVLTAHGFTVLEAVPDGPSLHRALREHRPDVCVVDVRLPPTFTDEGLRVAIEARREIPGLPVLVLSQYVEQLYAKELLSDRAGGVGYLLKDRISQVRDFVDALRRVAAGGTALDPEVVAQLIESRARNDPLDELSGRERDVLALVAQGRTNSAIGQTLYITEKAVAKHINSIFKKLDISTSTEDNRRVLAVLTYLQA